MARAPLPLSRRGASRRPGFSLCENKKTASPAPPDNAVFPSINGQVSTIGLFLPLRCRRLLRGHLFFKPRHTLCDHLQSVPPPLRAPDHLFHAAKDLWI